MSDDFLYTDSNYWQERWILNETDFHMKQTHPMIMKHLEKLTSGVPCATILIPLCGKSLDMIWIASQGHKVIGVEISEVAVKEFFNENKIDFDKEETENFTVYTSKNGMIKIYNGDFLKFKGLEPSFSCVWDRGGLVALPSDLRIKYASHLLTLIEPGSKYLLDTLKYDPEFYKGPPQLVTSEEVRELYGEQCKIELIDTDGMNPFCEKLKDKHHTKELLFLLTCLN